MGAAISDTTNVLFHLRNSSLISLRPGATLRWLTRVHNNIGERSIARGKCIMSTSAKAPVVLLVQRNDDAEMYAEFLTHEGVTVVTVSSAADALAAASRCDIVVTGIGLTGDISGLELVARLRADESMRDLPIIVLTASAWRVERDRALKAGCDLFLPKPCLPDDLLHQVRLLLAAGHGRAGRRPARAAVDEAADRRERGARKRAS